ncbi:thioredoxin family protein [bacterium]|nr:thioredoxin family protein [bacterium]
MLSENTSLVTKLDALVAKINVLEETKKNKILIMLQNKKSDRKEMNEIISYLVSNIESTNTQTTTNNSESAESRYVVYTPELVDQYLEDNKKVILNFSATRCPVCQALKKDIMTKLDSIPLDTVIVEVDYDTYEDLKDEYGVTKQTTLIYINKDKSEIARTYRPSFDDVI